MNWFFETNLDFFAFNELCTNTYTQRQYVCLCVCSATDLNLIPGTNWYNRHLRNLLYIYVRYFVITLYCFLLASLAATEKRALFSSHHQLSKVLFAFLYHHRLPDGFLLPVSKNSISWWLRDFSKAFHSDARPSSHHRHADGSLFCKVKVSFWWPRSNDLGLEGVFPKSHLFSVNHSIPCFQLSN